ncbi:MAG: metallophosphoesterase [Gammaproteobacteria bacterium]|nr:metallophosphoesterase [Gammaproteobacteria bacterium]
MRILHTSNCHLGKTLDHYFRLDEQQKVMQEIIHIADSQKVDVVLIAGDIFEQFNLSVNAII